MVAEKAHRPANAAMQVRGHFIATNEITQIANATSTEIGSDGESIKMNSSDQATPIMILATLIAIGVSGCSIPPKVTIFDKSRTYSASKDQIWTRLIRLLSESGTQIKTIEKESGIVYAERSLIDNSFADCGAEPLTVEQGRTGTFNVFVSKEGAKTTVTVNTQYKIVRTFDNHVLTAECKSTGLLERVILDGLAKSQ